MNNSTEDLKNIINDLFNLTLVSRKEVESYYKKQYPLEFYTSKLFHLICYVAIVFSLILYFIYSWWIKMFFSGLILLIILTVHNFKRYFTLKNELIEKNTKKYKEKLQK